MTNQNPALDHVQTGPLKRLRMQFQKRNYPINDFNEGRALVTMTDQILIKDLPAHIRMRAEENRAIYRSRQNGSYCSPWLDSAFCWSRAPEGRDFWALCDATKFEAATQLLES